MVGLYLYPLLRLRPPLPLMSPEERLAFIRKRFLAEIPGGRARGLWRTLTRAMIRLASQMTYLGYYSDPRSFEAVGYVPFSRRDRYAADVAKAAPATRRVRALRPADLNGGGKAATDLTADAVVVGSGAAGAIIAAELAGAGKEVLIVERGEHVDPSDFTEDEAEMITRLYSDGALQLARDFRFQVLQGMCVGGSTVVNNAVCFEIPPRVLGRWNGEHAAGLDPDRLGDCFAAVRERLLILPQPPEHLNPGASKFTDGIEALGLGGGDSGVVEANISGCIGCGYCNIGCRFGKKLSMLDTVLPDAQHDHGDRLRILSECRAEGIEREYGRVTGVHCRLADGREVRVRAPLVVVSAGAVNSSFLLLRSGVAGPVGEGLSFNMASPITAEFDEVLNSYDGLQISHYFDPGEGADFVAETWFNPVLSQALNMPGWLEDHYLNMTRYSRMTAAGALVGTERTGRVKKALLGGPDIVYSPSPNDLSRLLEGVKTVGRIFLAGGAERVMPLTFQYHEFRSERELDRLDDLVRGPSDISLGTGHPQGGNAIGQDPATSVVDPGFAVRGTEGLYVCDASVFPSSLTVNPQMTVMALAEYAADEILGRQRPRSPAPPAAGPGT
jgi:choline dehydrogenase-like flavoprotein